MTAHIGARPHWLVGAFLIATAIACGRGEAPPPRPTTPAAQFMSAVETLCGQAFAGRVVANEPTTADDPFEGQSLIMHVRSCEPRGQVLVPFHVGEDRSRTWILSRLGGRVRLKHDHRHQDGTEDVLTMYGGDSAPGGTAVRQEFPVDEFSKELFSRETCSAIRCSRFSLARAVMCERASSLERWPALESIRCLMNHG